MAKKMSKGAIIGISVGSTIVVAGTVTAALVCTLHGKTVYKIEYSKYKRAREKGNIVDKIALATLEGLIVTGETTLKEINGTNQQWLDLAKFVKDTRKEIIGNKSKADFQKLIDDFKNFLKSLKVKR